MLHCGSVMDSLPVFLSISEIVYAHHQDYITVFRCIELALHQSPDEDCFLSAMIHAGVGPIHFNAIVTTLGLPPISEKTLKERERDIGPFIEAPAKESCASACKEEKLKSVSTAEEIDTVEDIDGDNYSFEEALDLLENGFEDWVLGFIFCSGAHFGSRIRRFNLLFLKVRSSCYLHKGFVS